MPEIEKFQGYRYAGKEFSNIKDVKEFQLKEAVDEKSAGLLDEYLEEFNDTSDPKQVLEDFIEANLDILIDFKIKKRAEIFKRAATPKKEEAQEV